MICFMCRKPNRYALCGPCSALRGRILYKLRNIRSDETRKEHAHV